MTATYRLTHQGVSAHVMCGDVDMMRLEWEHAAVKFITSYGRIPNRLLGEDTNVRNLLRTMSACSDLANREGVVPTDVHGIADRSGVVISSTVYNVAVLIAAQLLEPTVPDPDPKPPTEDLASCLMADALNHL